MWTVWTGGDGGCQYFLTSDGEGSVDGGATEGEPLPLRWLVGTGYSQFRSMGGPGWGDDTPVFRGGRALAIAESGGSVANPISVVFKHGPRQRTGTSLTQLEVESDIAAHVRNLGVGAGASWGWVQVEGQWILYRLHILANNVRSVGTYFPVDGPLLPK